MTLDTRDAEARLGKLIRETEKRMAFAWDEHRKAQSRYGVMIDRGDATRELVAYAWDEAAVSYHAVLDLMAEKAHHSQALRRVRDQAREALRRRPGEAA